MLDKQGQYAEAEKIHRETFELLTKVHGAEHPYTLLSENNIAHMLERQGRYAEAVTRQRKTVELFTKYKAPSI